jgi:hypothetical protein
MEPEGLLPYAKEPAVGSCPEPDEPTPHPHSVFM